MLHVTVLTPSDTTDAVLDLVDGNVTVCNVVYLPGAARSINGDVVQFDLARENANAILQDLRALDLEDRGSISFDEAETLISKAAQEAEKAAPGRPEDGVIWDAIEEKAYSDCQLSWSFVVFLTLATLIAGTGRYFDQLILIVGAMVVGPEFAPVSAFCFGIARNRHRLIRPALGTLFGGMAIAVAVSTCFWAAIYAFGGIDRRAAATGNLTQFIVQPDIWSLVIALLAGTAGVLSLTASKSATLVGVFISVTTVPAVGTIALTVAVGLWDEAWKSVIQLAINLVGLAVAGIGTLLVQRLVWERVVLPRQRRAADGSLR